MDMILHITTQTAWKTAVRTNIYHSHSLQTEGFIHCSTIAQVLLPANELYRGRSDLLLLCINPDRVEAPIIYEDCYETGQAFPHVYGPLNVNAVTKIVHFPPNADGSFSLPPALRP